VPPKMKIQFRALRVENLSLNVRLGCTIEERSRPQEVRITYEFRYRAPLRGETTDDIDDVVCYAAACEALRKHCETGEYKLIERLAVECLGILYRSIAGKKALVAIMIHKVRPPVSGLLGGATYSCGDFSL
jgi:dihydroneopterin aldolase